MLLSSALATFASRLRSLRTRLLGRINVRGELFSAALTFVGLAGIRLASSLILTRLLYPEAYGVIAVLASALYVIEMLSDVGAVGLVTRHERATDPQFLNTVWTVRFLRCLLNGAAVFLLAPWIAQLYGDPALAMPLRVISLWFLLAAGESMAFALCMRAQRSRTVGFVELGATLISTVFVVLFSLYSRDHWGMVFGMLVARALTTAASYVYGPRHRPAFAFEKAAWREMFAFSKYVAPTSMLTMVISQFDRVVFLRLFDLKTLGLYGVAASVAGPVGSLSVRLTQFVLYPRCAAAFRESPQSLRRGFYVNNAKLLLMLISVPASIGGAAPEIVELLFDHRYAAAGFVLQAFMIRSTVQGILAPAQSLLIAAGHPKVPFVANVLRLSWLVPGALLGYYLFGFHGFVLLAVLDVLPATAYVLWVQYKRRLLVARFECWRLVYAAAVWSLAYIVSSAIGESSWWIEHVR